MLRTEYGTIHPDLSVTTPQGATITRERMAEIAREFRNVNRIHKPFLLLVWTDYKNGKRSNWESE